MGENSFLYEVTSIYSGGNDENERVASPERVPIHLKAKKEEKMKKEINKKMTKIFFVTGQI